MTWGKQSKARKRNKKNRKEEREMEESRKEEGGRDGKEKGREREKKERDKRKVTFGEDEGQQKQTHWKKQKMTPTLPSCPCQGFTATTVKDPRTREDHSRPENCHTWSEIWKTWTLVA